MIDIISSEIFSKIFLHAPSPLIEKFTLPLNTALNEFDITTVNRIAAFLAQVGHESGSLHYVRELASGEAYSNRADLGNTLPEAIAIAQRNYTSAGKFWKGRGLLQITGYDAYVKASQYFKNDFVNHPDRLEAPIFAARSAGWVWKWKKLNPLADSKKFKEITRRINGGYNGYNQRLVLYEHCLQVLSNHSIG